MAPKIIQRIETAIMTPSIADAAIRTGANFQTVIPRMVVMTKLIGIAMEEGSLIITRKIKTARIGVRAVKSSKKLKFKFITLN